MMHRHFGMYLHNAEQIEHLHPVRGSTADSACYHEDCYTTSCPKTNAFINF